MLLNVMLEKTLESLLDCKEIKQLNPKRNQSWIFIGRTDAEAPILWSHDVKKWLIGKDPDAGNDWRQEEKGMTGWDGWIASLTQWTRVWANSRNWWWTGKPDMLQSKESQRVKHNWATELNWAEPRREHYWLLPQELCTAPQGELRDLIDRLSVGERRG